MSKVFDNGVLRDMTAKEQEQHDALQKEWADGSKDRKLSRIKKIRLEKLEQTDYLGLSDVTMSDEVKTWRQALRDIPQNNTTETKYDELLAKDSEGNLTHTIWEKP